MPSLNDTPLSKKFIEELNLNDIKFKVYHHEQKTISCQQSAIQRSVNLNQTLKCMLAKAKDLPLLVLMLRGDHKLKIKRVRAYLNTKVELLDETEINKLGLTRGAISPFILSQKFIPIVDEGVLEISWMTFSAGLLDVGVGISSHDLINLLHEPRITLIRSTSKN